MKGSPGTGKESGLSLDKNPRTLVPGFWQAHWTHVPPSQGTGEGPEERTEEGLKPTGNRGTEG